MLQLRVDKKIAAEKKNMLPGSKRGPKDKKWTKPAEVAFAKFFAKRSEPLPAAPSIDEAPLTEASGAGLKWLFSSFGNEPVQVKAAESASIRNIVLGITGALVAIGVGQEPGVGTCHSYWAVDEVEVAEGTASWPPRRRMRRMRRQRRRRMAPQQTVQMLLFSGPSDELAVAGAGTVEPAAVARGEG